MKKLLLSLACVAGLSLAATAAEASFSIVYSDDSSDGSANLTENLYNEDVESTPNYSTFVSATKVFKGVHGLKFGSKSANGSLTIGLVEEAQVNATKIIVNACAWTSSANETDEASLSVNSSEAQKLTKDLADYTYELDGEKLTQITLDATARLYVKSITVYYEGEELPEFTDLWLRGYKGWDATNDNKLNTTDGVNYTLEGVVLYVGNEFKVANEDWSTNFGGASDVVAGTEYTLTENGSNITAGEEMTCTVNFNLDTKVLKLVKTGEAPQPVITYQIWASWAAEGLDWGGVDLEEEDGVWSATNVRVAEDGEFGIKLLTDGNQTSWLAAAEETTVDATCNVALAVNGKNIKVKAGKYNFAFNPEEMSLAIELIPAPAGVVYKQISTVAEITLGDEYVLYYDNEKNDISLGLGEFVTAKSNYFSAIAGVVVEDGEINTGDNANADLHALKIVAGTADGTYALVDGEKYVKCSSTSSNGAITLSDELVADCNLTISAEEGIFSLLFTENSNDGKNLFQCNSSKNQERFTNYTKGTQNNLKLFKKDNTETAVSTIAVENTEKVVYNLQGVRVNAERLPAGLYIINGKKVLVK